MVLHELEKRGILFGLTTGVIADDDQTARFGITLDPRFVYDTELATSALDEGSPGSLLPSLLLELRRRRLNAVMLGASATLQPAEGLHANRADALGVAGDAAHHGRACSGRCRC